MKFIVRRIWESIPVMLIVVTMTFFFVRVAPGGPFDSEKAASPDVIKHINERYHLNDPLYQQYWTYLTSIVQGDFGPSFKYPGRTVQDMILEGMPRTFELGFYALMVALLMGCIPGITAALKRNTLLDYIPMSGAMIGICVPSFLLGPLLVLIFGIWLDWLPVSGWTTFDSKILPSITLGTAYAAYIARLSRSGMLEILNQDFIRTARAKGVPEFWVIVRHALRGGLTPVISFMGPAIAGLLTGSFVVETIFQIPGLGRYYVQAAFNRDYTMIMGTTILISFMIVFFNMISDIVHHLLNPRLSFEQGH